jgi:hypothetical protein
MVVSSRLLPRCLVPVSGTFKRLEAGRLRAQSSSVTGSRFTNMLFAYMCLPHGWHCRSKSIWYASCSTGRHMFEYWIAGTICISQRASTCTHQAPTPMRSWRVEARTFVSSSMHARTWSRVTCQTESRPRIFSNCLVDVKTQHHRQDASQETCARVTSNITSSHRPAQNAHTRSAITKQDRR